MKSSKHTRDVHSEQVPCKVCGKQFSSEVNTERHENLSHDEMQFHLPRCEFWLTRMRKNNLKRHSRNISECAVCIKNFEKKSCLLEHMKSHEQKNNL